MTDKILDTLAGSIIEKYKSESLKLHQIKSHKPELNFAAAAYDLVIETIYNSLELGIKYGRLAQTTEQVFNVKINPN